MTKELGKVPGQFGHAFVGRRSHGQHVKLNQLQDRARTKGHQIGQFLDDKAAAPYVAEIAKRGPGKHEVPLPSGLKTRSVLPDGSIVQPNSLRVIVNRDGKVITAFPFNSNFAN